MSQNRLQDFDQQFRDKLSEHELPVSDDLWSKIDLQRNPRKKRYPSAIMFIVFLGIIGMGYGLYNYYSPSIIEFPEDLNKEHSPTQSNEQFVEDVTTDRSLSENITTQKDLRKIGSTNPDFNNSAFDLSQQSTKNSVKKLDSRSSKNKTRFKSKIVQEPTDDFILQNESDNEFVADDLTRDSYLFQSLDKLPSHKPDKINSELINQLNKCAIFSSKSQLANISFEFSAGPALSFHKTESTSAYDDFVVERNQIEEPLVNYGFSTKLKKEWYNNTTASVGFNFSAFNYKYVEIDSNVTRQTVITIDTFYQGHELVTRTDTLYRREVGIRKSQTGITHQLFSFPVSAGYKFDVQDLYVEPYAGLTFNIYQQRYGSQEFLQNLLEEPVYEVIDYKSRLGVMAHAGLTIGYNITPRMSLILQPEYHQSWSPVTRENLPVQEYRYWLNINLGFKYKLMQTKK